MDEEKDVYLQLSPPHLSIKSMDIYSIYTYEIHEGDKSLLYKDTGQKAIDRAHDIVSPSESGGGDVLTKKNYRLLTSSVVKPVISAISSNDMPWAFILRAFSTFSSL